MIKHLTTFCTIFERFGVFVRENLRNIITKLDNVHYFFFLIPSRHLFNDFNLETTIEKSVWWIELLENCCTSHGRRGLNPRDFGREQDAGRYASNRFPTPVVVFHPREEFQHRVHARLPPTDFTLNDFPACNMVTAGSCWNGSQ